MLLCAFQHNPHVLPPCPSLPEAVGDASVRCCYVRPGSRPRAQGLAAPFPSGVAAGGGGGRYEGGGRGSGGGGAACQPAAASPADTIRPGGSDPWAGWGKGAAAGDAGGKPQIRNRRAASAVHLPFRAARPSPYARTHPQRARPAHLSMPPSWSWAFPVYVSCSHVSIAPYRTWASARTATQCSANAVPLSAPIPCWAQPYGV